MSDENQQPAPETSPSTADDRTRNNDVRHQYRTLTGDEKASMTRIKDAGQALIDVIKATPGFPSRELALGVTNAEQAVMWAVKHVTA